MANRKSTKKLKPSQEDLLKWQLRKFALDGLKRKLDPQQLKLDIKQMRSMITEEIQDMKRFGLTRDAIEKMCDKAFFR